MKKISLALVLLSLVFSLTMPGGTLAQTSDEPDTQQIRKCEQIQNKLEQKIQNWQERKEAKVERWKIVNERINKVIEKLRAKGYDVTPLEEDREVMQGLIDEMQVAYQNVIAKAQEARSNACSDKELFKTNMAELKELMQIARDKWQELTGFMKNEFIPDIKSYKELISTPTP